MKNINFKNLESERLILRKFSINDADEMYKNWTSDDLVTKYLPWDTHKDIEETKMILTLWEEDYKKDYPYRYAVVIKDTNELIGSIDIVENDVKNNIGEIGYCYSRNSWNKGYATEALKLFMEFLFIECDYRVLFLKHHSDNEGSGRVMAKAGLIKDGILKNRILDKDGSSKHLIYYSITKKECL